MTIIEYEPRIILEEHEKKKFYRNYNINFIATTPVIIDKEHSIITYFNNKLLTQDQPPFNYFITTDGTVYLLVVDKYVCAGNNDTYCDFLGGPVVKYETLQVALQTQNDMLTHEQINSLNELAKFVQTGVYPPIILVNPDIKSSDYISEEYENGWTVFELIRQWAIDRNLDTADSFKQIAKLGEEFGELCKSFIEKDMNEFSDAIGDMFVVLTILAQQQGLEIENCIEQAWKEIKDRTGKTIDGVFIKSC